MNKVVKFISKLMIACYLLLPVAAHAGALEDYEEAHKHYLVATACMAAYSDRVGGFALDTLDQEGWKTESYIKTSDKADARFLLSSKMQGPNNQPLYLLAVVGTETLKDVMINLLVSKVYFAGETPEEFAANAARKDISNAYPKVHKGYNHYVQEALAAEGRDGTEKAKRRLTDMLLEHKERKLYLVGHSMGGATATLAGARLISMGVRPEQIEIITFGAPAVGNEAFKKKFEPVLNLTRIVTEGDPVNGAMQTLVKGYEEFGQQVRWQVPSSATIEPHQITMYLDLATKHYYQKRQQAIQAGVMPELVNQTASAAGVPKIYVAPIINRLSSELQEEFFYMKEALQDEYRRALPGYVIDTAQAKGNVFEKAKLAGCEWVLVTEIQEHKIKDEQSGYYIILEQSLQSVSKGDIVKFAAYGRSSRTSTPLQALIHDARNMKLDSHEWLAQLQASKK
ncbi:MAG: lipase family protein [Sporomusaceae bacterium]|nr:lipase family protein [Sporomusaceae bacterium]